MDRPERMNRSDPWDYNTLADAYDQVCRDLEFQVAKVACLRAAAAYAVARYDEDHPMRHADFHRTDCGCLRCDIDAARVVLRDEKAEKERK